MYYLTLMYEISHPIRIMCSCYTSKWTISNPIMYIVCWKSHIWSTYRRLTSNLLSSSKYDVSLCFPGAEIVSDQELWTFSCHGLWFNRKYLQYRWYCFDIQSPGFLDIWSWPFFFLLLPMSPFSTRTFNKNCKITCQGHISEIHISEKYLSGLTGAIVVIDSVNIVLVQMNFDVGKVGVERRLM